MAGMAWLATTPRSRNCCCGPAIASSSTAFPDPLHLIAGVVQVRAARGRGPRAPDHSPDHKSVSGL